MMKSTLCYMLLWALFGVGCVDSLREGASTQEARVGDPGDVCWTSGGRTCCIVDGETVCDGQTISADVQEMRACYPDGFCCLEFDNGDYLCCRDVVGGQTCYTSL